MIQNLIFDKRFRSIAFQIILFFTVLFLFYWFAQNASDNITARGDKFGFDFLNNSSGFSILPTLGTWLFDYQVGKSTYLDVFFIGIVNTLVIAFTGIFATTILGFLIGIFRLSNNIVLKFFLAIPFQLESVKAGPGKPRSISW